MRRALAVMFRPRGRRAVLLLALWALAACAAPERAAGPPREVRLTLLQINDNYTLEPVDDGRRGGLARLATLVKRVRAQSPHTLFVLAGDMLSPSVASTYLKGEQMIAGLNAAGLDVATFGNHEFDFGPAVLRARMRESAFAWLSSNVLERGTGQPFGGARGELVRTFDGVTVGLFALTTPEAASTSSPGPEVEFRDPVVAARQASARLRERGAQVVIAVTHLEMADDRALAATAGVDVDVILGGHEHEPLVAEEGKTLITKAGSDGRYLVQVDLWLTPKGRLLERSWTFHEVSARLPPDPAVAAVVERYAERLDRELDVVAGRTAVALEARRRPLRTQETNIGSFIADRMRERLGADVALINGGGIRTDRIVPAGPLTRRDVHGLLPFGNVALKLEMSGARLREALEHGVARVEREGGGFLQVSGVRLAFDPRRPPGQRIVEASVGGAPLVPERSYTVAVVDYLVRGGDGHTAFRDARVVIGPESGPLLAAILLDAIAGQASISPRTDDRIRAVGVP